MRSEFYYKSPYDQGEIQMATIQHKNAIKNFDHTAIAGRLTTISWSKDIHPTGVVKPVNGIPN